MTPKRARSLLSVAFLALYGALAVVPAARNPDTNGFAAYYTASRILLRDRGSLARVYDDAWFQARVEASGFADVHDIYNVQPPTMSLLMAPFAWLSPRVARLVWTAATVVFWVGSVIALTSAVFGGAITVHSVLPALAGSALFLPLQENLKQGQCYALLLFLLSAHLWLMARRAPWSAGVPLGAMLILKAAGLWLLPLLALSRQWKAALAAVGTAAAVALGTLPIIGWAPWRRFALEVPRFVGNPVENVTAYQTVRSLFGHLLVYDAKWSPHPALRCPLAASLAVGAVTLAALVQSVRYARGGDTLEGDEAGRVISIAMFAALGVTLAPVAERYHYLLLLPAVFVAWSHAITRGAPAASWAALVAGTALVCTPQALYTWSPLQAGWLALLSYPRVYGAFVLWAWLGRALSRPTFGPP